MKLLKALIMLTFRGFERKHLSLIAAGLAYYFMMSLLPALVVLAAVMAYVPMQDATRGATSFMVHVMPRQGLSLIEPMLATISPHRGGLLSFGIVATLWLASSGAKGIIAGLDVVNEVRVPRPFWLNRIFAFGLTVLLGMLLLSAIVLTLTGPAVEDLLAAVVPVQSLWIRIWPYIQWLVAAVFTFSAIGLFYLFGPNVPIAHRLTVPGAVVAASIWLALSGGLAFYFHQLGASKLGSYGALATPIALVVWLHWGASAILLGAELNVNLQLLWNREAPERKAAPDRLNSAA